MRKIPILTLALGAGLIAALAGCTGAANTTTADPTPSVTQPAPKPTTPANVGKCVDGTAVLVTSKDKPNAKLAGSCDSVSIVGTDGTVTLGTVKHLVVEGSRNVVTVESVEKIDFAAEGNTVTHQGAAPTVDEHGTKGNTVKAAG